MKKLVALILALCFILPSAGCTNATAPEIEVQSFSYAQFSETHQGMSFPMIRYDSFQNTSVSPINNAQDAIDRAKNECDVEYDTTDVCYDDTADMWLVCFYKEGYFGGGQNVYLDSNGITHVIEYTE